jgi:hypothetical protein
MPTLNVCGYSSPVEIDQIDPDGWCVVRFTSGLGGWLNVHVDSLTFDPAEQRPADALRTRGRLTGRQRAVLSALAKAGFNGLTDDEHEARNGLALADVRRAREQLQGFGYVRNGGRWRRCRDGVSRVVWEITTVGEHAYHSDRDALAG